MEIQKALAVKMKKRIHKKLHKIECQQFVMSIMVSTDVENIENSYLIFGAHNNLIPALE
jgi:uncharacterized protein YggL (DUF469 family)